MKSLDKLSSILDEHIEKGFAISSRPTSKIEAIEQDLMKGLSFDPFSPTLMTEHTQFYNPYMMNPSGGYMPYPDTYWNEQSDGRPRPSGGYETVREFYSIVNDRDENNPSAIHPLFQGPLARQLQSQSRFAQLRKSCVDFVFKGKPVAVGTVHTGPDGARYKKVAEGKWAPVADSNTRKFVSQVKDPKGHAEAAKHLESTASKHGTIKEHIDRKTRDQATIEEAKNQAVRAAAEHTKTMISGLYDGKVPKEIDAAHKEHLKAHGQKENSNPRKTLHAISHGLKPKHHIVEVHFKYDGQEYTHRFPQVEAQSHTEAVDRVSQILKDKLPGSQVSKIHAESPKERPSEKSAKKDVHGGSAKKTEPKSPEANV